ncbi:MAG: type II toxin-antitoxin system YhaV family toxin [Symploca sp. SIO1B1]|nr:type II toxin-antitoxin system YhaV family toxin [Symploca sp. SIO1B1]
MRQVERNEVLGWVNDTQSKRSYKSNTDAYDVFKKMIDTALTAVMRYT